MKLRFEFGAICLVLASVVSFADESSPTAEQKALQERIQDAVTRSLPYLENSGVAWMNERGCLSCHHVPFLLWTHRSAKAHGIQVDSQKLDEWDEWARKDSLKRRNQFKLSKNGLENADSSLLSAGIKEKLTPMVDRPYASENEFVTKLSEFLSEDELKANLDQLKKMAVLSLYSSDRNGGGLDVLAQLVIGDDRRSDDAAAKAYREGLLDLIYQMQLEDGSWTPGIQFATMRQWSLEEANRATTMWAALALAVDQSDNKIHADRINRAISYLKEQSLKSNNREILAVTLELAYRAKKSEGKSHDQLIAGQNTDGGWSWIEGRSSDPYTTGLTLYVFGRYGDRPRSGRARYGPLKRAAIDYLLAAQQNDGSWLTPSREISNTTDPERLKARDEIYHFWGTAWSVLGLLETLPEIQHEK